MLSFEWNFLGLSSEIKPMSGEKVIDGSTYYECDTGDFYIFYDGTWYKQTFITEDGINVYVYKFLMRKMFKKSFDSNISKLHIYRPDTGSDISFTSNYPSSITDMEVYGDTEQQTSPTPDNPQTVQVVTGEQTLTVTNGDLTSVHTIDLDSTELCKIGDYQDYIYKSGNDWYIHKENGKIVLDGTEVGWSVSHNKEAYLAISDAKGNNTTTYSNLFVYNSSAVTETATWGEYRFGGTNKNLIFFMAVVENTDLAGFRAWLNSHNTIVYYQLATPTDTKITDETLISQLEDILTYEFPAGTNNIVVTASNLPALLKLTITERD